MQNHAHLGETHLRALTVGSGITADIIAKRGYRTVTVEEAHTLGFRGEQSRPGLAIPIHGLCGGLVAWQLRPDVSRIAKGKPVKYETAARTRALPDVHPNFQEGLANPSVGLYITEGVKKGDAAASRGLTCIALTGGVYGFLTKDGVHACLIECVCWHHSDGRGRVVTIAFDSDVTSKKGVHDAAERLASALRGYGAEVQFLVLPPQSNGEKQGIDDYFVSGGTVDDLKALCTPTLPPLPDSAPKSTAKQSQADVLIAMAADPKRTELFHEPGNEEAGYATVGSKTTSRTHAIQGSGFRHWLTAEFLRRHRRAPTKDALDSAVATLNAMAIHEGNAYPVYRRVANHEHSLFVDLGNTSGTAVTIANRAWELVPNPPVRFIRPPGMRALPTPLRGGKIASLWNWVNIIEPGPRLLYLACLTSACIQVGPQIMLNLHGEKGAAKSTASDIFKDLVDPHNSNLRRPPKSEADLMIAAIHNHVIGFENVSSIPSWLSDALCALLTGGSFGGRKLYTDGEEFVMSARRPVVINGIPCIAAQSDLADRTVAIKLPRIPPSQRKSEKEQKESFLAAWPSLVGALLDVVAEVHFLLPSISVENLPRMADFARIGVATEMAVRAPAGTFMRAYRACIAELGAQTLESGVASLLWPLVQDRIKISGTWILALKELLRIVRAEAGDDHSLKRFLPGNERKLRADLERITPDLREFGVETSFPDRKKTGAIVKFERIKGPASERQLQASDSRDSDADDSGVEDTEGAGDPISNEPSTDAQVGGLVEPESRNGDAAAAEGNAPPSQESAARSLNRPASSGDPDWASMPVVDMLEEAHRRGVLVRLSANHVTLETEDPGLAMTEALQVAIDTRSAEVLAHFLGSPGVEILDYPPSLMLSTHEFQEFRIAERRKRSKVVELLHNGRTVTRWFHEVSPARMAEIAKELEEWIQLERARKAREKGEADTDAEGLFGRNA